MARGQLRRADHGTPPWHFLRRMLRGPDDAPLRGRGDEPALGRGPGGIRPRREAASRGAPTRAGRWNPDDWLGSLADRLRYGARLIAKKPVRGDRLISFRQLGPVVALT